MRYLALVAAFAGLSCAPQSDPPPTARETINSDSIPEATVLTQQPQTAVPNIQITAAAAAQVKLHLAEFSPQHHLRVTVQGSGCDGFQNKLDIDATFDPNNDLELFSRGLRIVIDKRSALFLAGAVIDWKSDGAKPGFSIANPNAKILNDSGTKQGPKPER